MFKNKYCPAEHQIPDIRHSVSGYPAKSLSGTALTVYLLFDFDFS